jgi:hypothetical protein
MRARLAVAAAPDLAFASFAIALCHINLLSPVDDIRTANLPVLGYRTLVVTLLRVIP